MSARAVGVLAAAVLVVLGTLHCYWAAGGRVASVATVPSHDGRPLFTPGPIATLVVAALLYAAALTLLGRLHLWGRWLPPWTFAAATWAIVVVFVARVVGDFHWVGVFKRVTDTPFARWDTRVYVPLCALLALAALVVACSER